MYSSKQCRFRHTPIQIGYIRGDFLKNNRANRPHLPEDGITIHDRRTEPLFKLPLP